VLTALISSIVGIIGAAAPDLLKMFQRRQDDKAERELLKLRHQMEMERLREQTAQKISEGQVTIAAADAAAWVEGIKAAIAAQPAQSGIKWVDGFNAALRPCTVAVLLALYAIATIGWIAPSGVFATLLVEAVQAVLGFLFGYRCLTPSKR
jgi:hypothetical protein